MLLQDYGKAEEERQATRIHMYLYNPFPTYPECICILYQTISLEQPLEPGNKVGLTCLGLAFVLVDVWAMASAHFLMHHDGCISMQMSTRHNQPKTV